MNFLCNLSASEFSENELGVSHKKIVQGDVRMAINSNYLYPFAAFMIFKDKHYTCIQ